MRESESDVSDDVVFIPRKAKRQNNSVRRPAVVRTESTDEGGVLLYEPVSAIQGKLSRDDAQKAREGGGVSLVIEDEEATKIQPCKIVRDAHVILTEEKLKESTFKENLLEDRDTRGTSNNAKPRKYQEKAVSPTRTSRFGDRTMPAQRRGPAITNLPDETYGPSDVRRFDKRRQNYAGTPRNPNNGMYRNENFASGKSTPKGSIDEFNPSKAYPRTAEEYSPSFPSNKAAPGGVPVILKNPGSANASSNSKQEDLMGFLNLNNASSDRKMNWTPELTPSSVLPPTNRTDRRVDTTSNGSNAFAPSIKPEQTQGVQGVIRSTHPTERPTQLPAFFGGAPRAELTAIEDTKPQTTPTEKNARTPNFFKGTPKSEIRSEIAPPVLAFSPGEQSPITPRPVRRGGLSDQLMPVLDSFEFKMRTDDDSWLWKAFLTREAAIQAVILVAGKAEEMEHLNRGPGKANWVGKTVDGLLVSDMVTGRWDLVKSAWPKREAQEYTPRRHGTRNGRGGGNGQNYDPNSSGKKRYRGRGRGGKN
ncbi:hypothetical protein EDC01DRAFT_775196 [Geopyxis carbonaria]|nr:hypothetical protein EDC01DRAFT_775196 [Geopyxis carbonaria]